MLVNNSDAAARLNSPMNLINRLRGNGDKRNNAMVLFGIGNKKEVPSVSDIHSRISANVGVEHPTENTSHFNPFSATQKIATQNIEQPQKIESPQPLALIPSPTPSPALADILENHESQIKLGLVHDKALDLLNNAVAALALKLEDVKADKLPSVISAASKTVESIRRERNEAAKNGSKDREVHYHFYTPIQKPVSDYNVIEITSSPV